VIFDCAQRKVDVINDYNTENKDFWMFLTRLLDVFLARCLNNWQKNLKNTVQIEIFVVCFK
jgi:hypothetical protein